MKRLQKINDWIIESNVRIAFVVLIIAVIIFLIIGFFTNSFTQDDFLCGIFVESFGMLLDLLIIGVFITWLLNRNEKKQLIQRYFDEIDDWRGWESKEASHRIRGNILRLNKMGITEIDLRQCYLANADLFQVDLTGSSLINANLCNAKLMAANLESTYLMNANFEKADLTGAIFKNANCRNASFCNAEIHSVDFKNTILQDADFKNAIGAPKIGCLTRKQFEQAHNTYNIAKIYPEIFKSKE